LPAELPRVMTVGRLDINSEGLILLTNDGGLARVLELPSTGWMRRYRVRAHGTVEEKALDALKRGVTIDGMVYGAVEAAIDRVQGSNVWLMVGLREGKNREVKRVLERLGLSVGRLIRVSYGPFQLGDLEPRAVREVRGRVLRDQLGERLAHAAGADFEAPMREPERVRDGSDRARPPPKPRPQKPRRNPHAHRRRTP
jgi:23S rRNA pseudouridine2605 synthase